jgi:hypothetical protein
MHEGVLETCYALGVNSEAIIGNADQSRKMLFIYEEDIAASLIVIANDRVK